MYIKLGLGDLAPSLDDLPPALLTNILASPILVASKQWKVTKFIGFTE